MELKFETPAEAVEFFKSEFGMSEEDAQTKANELFEKDETEQGGNESGEETTELGKATGALKAVVQNLSGLIDRLPFRKSAAGEGDGEGGDNPGEGDEDGGDGGDLGKSAGEGGDETLIDVTAFFESLSKDVTDIKDFQTESTGEFAKAFGAFANALEHINTAQKVLEIKVEKVTTLQKAIAKSTLGFSFTDLDDETLAGEPSGGGDDVQVPSNFGEVMKSLRAAKEEKRITGPEYMEAQSAWHNGKGSNPVVKAIYAKAMKK